MFFLFQVHLKLSFKFLGVGCMAFGSVSVIEACLTWMLCTDTETLLVSFYNFSHLASCDLTERCVGVLIARGMGLRNARAASAV